MGAEDISESKKREVDWMKVLFSIHVNILLIYGLYFTLTECSITTIVFCKYKISFRTGFIENNSTF